VKSCRYTSVGFQALPRSTTGTLWIGTTLDTSEDKEDLLGLIENECNDAPALLKTNSSVLWEWKGDATRTRY